MGILYILILILLIVLSVPIPFAVGGTSILLTLVERGGDFSTSFLAQRLISGLDNFLLIAVPLFLYAGNVMNSGKITKQIFNFAKAIVGSTRGGLGHVNVVSSVIFAGMSGTAVADAAGLGAIELKAMKDEGYDDGFSVGITGASSTLGPIIPPSLPLVIYGMLTSTSISGLLIAGIVPGALMAVAMMIYVEIWAVRHGMMPTGKFSWKKLWVEFKASFWSLLTPIIIIVGILCGIFTPTEAAAVAAVYATVLTLVTKGITLKELFKVIKQTAIDSGAILLVAGMAQVYGYMITRANIITEICAAIGTISTDPTVVGLMLIGFLLIVGCFLDCNAAIMILASTLVPILAQSGIDPMHFGVIMVLTLMIGVLTPPFGMVLFVMQKTTKLSMGKIVRSCLPFIIPLLAVDIILLLVPKLVTWLPGLM